jgi:uncharacterized protein (DUF4415 family)
MKSRTTERTRPPYKLSDAQIGQLKALDGRVPDTVDIPSAPDANWATAERGRHFAAVQDTVAIRLDGDVLEWLRRKGPGYQTEINRILREKMAAETAT